MIKHNNITQKKNEKITTKVYNRTWWSEAVFISQPGATNKRKVPNNKHRYSFSPVGTLLTSKRQGDHILMRSQNGTWRRHGTYRQIGQINCWPEKTAQIFPFWSRLFAFKGWILLRSLRLACYKWPFWDFDCTAWRACCFPWLGMRYRHVIIVILNLLGIKITQFVKTLKRTRTPHQPEKPPHHLKEKN